MISIIVPIHDAKKYLRRALDSIVTQTYSDWEAILVDDGSTDGSTAIIKGYSEVDTRFRLFTQKNQGVGAARNLGLKNAKGDWIIFLDSDDFLHPKALDVCIDAAEHDQSDMVAFTYNRAYRAKMMAKHILHVLGRESKVPSSYRKRIRRHPSHVATNIFHFATEYSHKVPLPGVYPKFVVKHCQVWRCMYKTSLIKGITFPEGIAYEDFPWWSEVMLRMPKTSILNLPLYYYTPNLRSTIFSSKKEYKIRSLETAIALATESYKDAPAEVKRLWEANFLKPFEDKLRKKRN